MGASPRYKLQSARRHECAQRPQPSGCGLNSRHRQIEDVLELMNRNSTNYSCFFRVSCGSTTASALFGNQGVNQRNNNVAAPAPISCAIMNPGASTGRIPAKVSLAARANVTAGLANEVDEVNQ